MSAHKSAVADLNQYPAVVPGYYEQAFKKTKQEKQDLKDAKRNHKAAIDADYGNEYTATQRKKIMNPKTPRLG